MEFRHTRGAGHCSGWFWTTLPEGFSPRTCGVSSSESIINLTASAGEANRRDKRLVEAGNNAGASPEGLSPQAPAVSRQEPGGIQPGGLTSAHALGQVGWQRPGWGSSPTALGQCYTLGERSGVGGWLGKTELSHTQEGGEWTASGPHRL